jgi:cytochrome P450
MKMPYIYPDTLYKLTSLYREEQKAQLVVDTFQSEMISERRKLLERQNNNKSGHGESMKLNSNIALNLIAFNEENFTPQEAQDQLSTFFTGSETLTVAMSNIMLLIAMHPKEQDLLYEEIQTTIFSDADQVTSSKISSMNYLDLVLRECLRLIPPIPLIFRELTEDLEIQPGVVLPKKTCLFLNIYSLHRQEKYWGKDAHEFKPERFISSEDFKFVYEPFSAGHRVCIAYKFSYFVLKTAIVKLLQNFKFSTELHLEDLVFKSFTSIKISTPHAMKITRRQK